MSRRVTQIVGKKIPDTARPPQIQIHVQLQLQIQIHLGIRRMHWLGWEAWKSWGCCRCYCCHGIVCTNIVSITTIFCSSWKAIHGLLNFQLKVTPQLVGFFLSFPWRIEMELFIVLFTLLGTLFFWRSWPCCVFIIPFRMLLFKQSSVVCLASNWMHFDAAASGVNKAKLGSVPPTGSLPLPQRTPNWRQKEMILLGIWM